MIASAGLVLETATSLTLADSLLPAFAKWTPSENRIQWNLGFEDGTYNLGLLDVLQDTPQILLNRHFSLVVQVGN